MKKVNKIFMFLGVSLFLAVNSIFVNASEQVFYSDNYAEALHEIKNHSDFKITIGAEYYFIVEDKETGEKYQRNIRSDRSKEFEQYCKDDLNIDLNSMLPKNVVQVKYDDKEKTRDVISDKGVTGSGKISQNLNSSQSEVLYASSDTQNKKLYASNDTQNDLQNNPYQVTFSVNGGEGNNTTIDAICSYKLPSFTGVSFKPSAGKEFIGWSKNPSGPVMTGENIIISGSTMLYAIWDYTCRNETGVYVLTGESDCPKNANCVECPALKKWKFESCQTGYVDDGNGTCRPLNQGCTTGVLNEYPLTSCPDGAICAYTGCSGRYKIDHCQDDYELQDDTCKCHKEMHVTGTLSGSYECGCRPYRGSDRSSDSDMCTLKVYMEDSCYEYEVRNGAGVESGCESRDPGYRARSPREVSWWINRNEADSYPIDNIDRYSNIKGESKDHGGSTIVTWHGYRDRSEYTYYENRNGEKKHYIVRFDNSLYLTKTGCKYIGEEYFGTKSAGKKIDLVHDYSDKACKQDCTGFDLDKCPENKKCLVCGGKYKAVADHYENKGWKCYKLHYDFLGMRESDECNCEEYKRKSKDNTIFTSIETGCDYDTYMCVTDTNDPEKKEKFYSGVCGACSDGYDMGESGKCEYVPCTGSYWMEVLHVNHTFKVNGTGKDISDDTYFDSIPIKEEVSMNGCKQEGKQFCQKHYGGDRIMVGVYYGDANDGCTYHNPNGRWYFKCNECEDGYELINDACVAKSGVGSICYYKRGANRCYTYDQVKSDTKNVYTPIGIIFKETSRADYIVSLENLGGLTYDYTYNAPAPRGISYYWEEAKENLRDYAPDGCENGSFCGKGKWSLPSVEEMQEIASGFDDGGALVQAIRGLEISCSEDNSKRLHGGYYWTNQYTGVQTSKNSFLWRGLFIQAAYTVSSYGGVGWGGIRDHDGDADTAGFAYARPVLTLRKNDNSELGSSTLSVEFSSSTSLGG